MRRAKFEVRGAWLGGLFFAEGSSSLALFRWELDGHHRGKDLRRMVYPIKCRELELELNGRVDIRRGPRLRQSPSRVIFNVLNIVDSFVNIALHGMCSLNLKIVYIHMNLQLFYTLASYYTSPYSTRSNLLLLLSSSLDLGLDSRHALLQSRDLLLQARHGCARV